MPKKIKETSYLREMNQVCFKNPGTLFSNFFVHENNIYIVKFTFTEIIP